MGRLSEQELRQKLVSGQPMTVKDVINIIEPYGFKVRSSTSGSHTHCVSHPEHSDIKLGALVSNTKTLGMQRNAIRACLKILNREAEHPETINAKDGFDKASGTPPCHVGHFNQSSVGELDLPDNIEVIHGRKRAGLFLRHKQFPQIATEVEHYQPDYDLSDWLSYIEGRADRFQSALDEATAHGFETKAYECGTLVLSHPKHNIELMLRPFKPRLSNYTSISLIEEAVSAVQLIEEDHTLTERDLVDALSASRANNALLMEATL